MDCDRQGQDRSTFAVLTIFFLLLSLVNSVTVTVTVSELMTESPVGSFAGMRLRAMSAHDQQIARRLGPAVEVALCVCRIVTLDGASKILIMRCLGRYYYLKYIYSF